MARSRLHIWGVFPLVALAWALAAGCQDSDPGSLRSIVRDDFAIAPASDPCLKPSEADRLLGDILERVNRERHRRGLPLLERDSTLDRIADFYACRLVDGGFFSHIDPYDDSRIETRAADFGYAFRKIGENLGAGQLSVEQVMREWMNSPGHRDNILDPDFTQIGLAVRVGGTHGVYWVQEFGRPLTSQTAAEVFEVEPRSGTESRPDASPEAASQPSAHAAPWIIDELESMFAFVAPF